MEKGSRPCNTLHHYPEAKKETGANVSVVYVPAPFAADSILEAADAELDTICVP
jgi:succinyl-CoA synthetase alpha subunit